MKPLLSIAALIFFFAVGFYTHKKSQEFPAEVSEYDVATSRRDPAAIKKVYDFSNLEGTALSFAAKQRLLEGAELLHDKKDVGVSLGHFVIKGQSGEKQFACERYEKVFLQFEGEGIAVAGELPAMEVESNCSISEDINRIAAIWIPVSRIMGEPVADGEFDFREGRAIKLRFANVSDQWPTVWRLRSVKLSDPKGTYGDVVVEPNELRTILKRPFLVEF